MLTDFNYEINDSISQNTYDVCIIGAGAAGITLALTLAKKKKRVALIEGGGLEPTDESQEIYKGNVVGHRYYELDETRLRFLGGSTNHWIGMCRSFDKVDFERGYLGKEYVWPIEFSEIEKYKKDACQVLEIPDEFEQKNVRDEIVRPIKYQFSPPVNFKDKYEKYLADSDNIDLILNANLTNMIGKNSSVEGVKIVSFSGNKFDVKAHKIVLAMGGIENSRFLLWFDKKYNGKFFSRNLPIGQYWMEHPHAIVGEALIDKRAVRHTFYSLSENKQKQLGVLNCGFELLHHDLSYTSEQIRRLLCVAPSLGKKIAELAQRELICSTTIRTAWEQSPSINSQIKLIDSVDKFGVPQVELRWITNNFDRKTLDISLSSFNSWLMANDKGRIVLEPWMLNKIDYPADERQLAGHHHMGGTRMTTSPAFGVVDKNCKVFGSKNIFVAGSSIFTTGGHNNPTLPIVQFSLRLSDYLAS